MYNDARSDTRKHLPDWIQIVCMVAILCVTLLLLYEPYRREQRLVRAVEAAGGSFATKNCPPEWAIRLLGDEHLPLFNQITVVDLQKTNDTDSGLNRLRGVKNLQYLHLGCSDVTDAGLAHLRDFKKLKLLSLRETSITDAGLAHLRGITNLEYLYLSKTVVTDAGLLELCGNSSLKMLSLHGTSTTAQGIAVLQKALPNCNVVTSRASTRANNQH